MDAPIPCVGAYVRNEQGQVLLVRRANDPGRGRWSVPGGRQEFGETARAAVVREVREETGLEVEVGDLVWQVDLIEGLDTDAARHYAVVDFHARVVGGSLGPGDDADEVRWVAPGDLRHLDLVPSVAAFLRAQGFDTRPG